MFMFKFDIGRAMLVIVDPQNCFVHGELGTEEAVAAMGNVETLAEARFAMIAVTRDTHDADYAETLEGRRLDVIHGIRGTEGWEFAGRLPEILGRRDNVITFEKSTFGSIALARLVRDLWRAGKIDAVVFCGFDSDVCVVTNALMDRAFTGGECEMAVIEDACAGTTPAAHEAALAVLRSCQFDVVTTDEVLGR